jgi:hypothetical protein
VFNDPKPEGLRMQWGKDFSKKNPQSSGGERF